MRVTVAICTFNRAALLDKTLEAFKAVRIPADVTWELIVVDNNCTDQTPQVVEKHRHALPLRSVLETEVGLCAARNRAISEAAGDLILWTDDDVIVSPEWIALYAAAAREWPNASFFGGTVEPWFASTPPEWVARNIVPLSEPYALAQNGYDTRDADGVRIVGANMAYRTHVLRQYRFDTGVGQIGAGAMRGDETELMARLRAAGLRGVWVGAASVKHYIQADRMSTDYLWHWYGGLGELVARQKGLPPTALVFGAPRWAVKEYGRLLLSYWVQSRKKDAGWIKTLRQAGLMRGYIAYSRRVRKTAHTTAAASSAAA